MIFPILPVVTGWLSAWHLFIDILFVVAYLGVLTTRASAYLGYIGVSCDLCSWEYTAFDLF